ncbi:MAG: ATP-binding protein [Chloroflexota bacterium]
MWKALHRHLAFKLFLSYLVVILVGALVLTFTVEAVIPRVFDRHLLAMSRMMGMMMGGAQNLEADLFASFRSGVNEALALAAVAAVLAALAASLLVSRQVTAPIQSLKKVSQRIAEGHYEQRVCTPDGPPADYDELAQLAQAFNQMAARLEQIEDMRRQLIGDVSHELRTPLTAIKGSLEGLIDGVLPPDPETFQQIHGEAQRMQRLVEDLQELSRVEAGAYELQRQPLSISSLAQTAVQRLERSFTEKGVSLQTDLPANLPPVTSDAGRLEQVLLNLLGNALQYTPAGGRVNLRASLKGAEVQVAVEDTGVGIPAEHLPHLFTRFYRVDPSRSRASGGGSGIGLTIARHLVEAHGGRIWAHSPGAGQGSTFTFTLPSAQTPPPAKIE